MTQTRGDTAAASGEQRRSHDLRVRAISAAIMVPTCLACLVAGQAPFAALVAAMTVLLLREWVRMVNRSQSVPAVLFGSTAILAAIVLTFFQLTDAAFLMLPAGALCVAALARTHRLWSAGGVFYAGLPAVALVHLRGLESGLFAVIVLMCVVWVTDIAAYAGGRSIGGPKLWPAVSPKKTWAGFLSGLAGAGVAGLVAWMVAGPDDLYGAPAMLLVALAIVVSVAGQLGDLFESHIKRRCGVKDSGTLIPGHGGAMDRLDSLVTAATVAALFAIAFALPRVFQPFMWSSVQ